MRRFERVEMERSPNYKASNSKLRRLLEGFDKSGLKNAKVLTPKYKTARNGLVSIGDAIKRLGMSHIQCKIINDELYLVKTKGE